MSQPDETRPKPARKEVTAAWAVHAFTASGIVLGFLALVSILEGDKLGAFMWLGLALFVDGIDGTLARRARVKEVVPQVDGTTLDNVVDFFTYVIVPAMMIYWFNLVPDGLATISAAMVLLVSTYTFSNAGIKSDDYYFVGFPAVWNIVVLYFHILETGPWVNLAVLIICAVLTFVPWKYVHPFRVKDWRVVTIPVTVLWAATTLRLVFGGETAHPASTLVFLLWVGSSLYFAVLSAWRSMQPDAADDED